MRRTASEILSDLEVRIARLENASNFRYASKEESVAKAIAKAVAPSFEESLGVPAFETPQAEVDERTGQIIVSQRMRFRLSEAQFGSRLPSGQGNIERLPRSKSFKKTLSEAILEEAWEERIVINSLGQKSTRVNYRELAKEYTFTGEVSNQGDDLEVEDLSLKRGNFSITILYTQYFKPAEARGEDMESYMRDDYNY